MDRGTRHSLKERRTHGSSDFPLAAYWMDMAPGEHVVDCHLHDEAEFFLVLEGSTLFQIGTSYYRVRAGEAVFIPGGEIHAGYPLDRSGCKFCAVVFDAGWLRSGSYDRLQSDYILPLEEGRQTLPSHYRGHAAWEKNVLAHLGEIVRLMEQRPDGYPLAVKARLFLILAEIAAGNHWVRRDPAANLDKLNRLKSVLGYIEAHYDRKLELQELAAIAHMSEGHFCRFFKSMVRKTPVEYINAYRIKRAAEMLENTDRKVMDIAMDVGFDNLSYFIQRFRRQMLCTPAQYRKRRRQQDVAAI